MVKVVPEQDVRERVTTFAMHAGLVYALMTSASISGLLWDPAAVLAATDIPAAAGPLPHNFDGTVSSLVSVMGTDAVVLKKAAHNAFSTFFVISTGLNIHGLLTSMLAVGRVNVLPDSKIKQFVLDNSIMLHTVGWCLIPSVASLCGGLICAVELLHGEPATTIAVVVCTAVGLSTMRNTVVCGMSTEALSDEAIKEERRC